MEESQYEEIMKRLDKIEKLLEPLATETGYMKKITSNLIGNMVWEWAYHLTRGSGLHPPEL